MARPVILNVDDEPAVARAVERDLRARYGADYRLLSASSGAEALTLLERLTVRGDPVALLVADHRMPEMDGVSFLGASRRLAPVAKRVLLTAYADTDAAIRAINDVGVDQYLRKPWDPPEERLYPVLTELLDDWQAFHRPDDRLRVVGHRFSEDSHRVRDFLTRNGVPFKWLDVETDAEAARVLEAAHVDGAGPDTLPLVPLSDGTVLTRPTNLELAQRIGLSTQARRPFYDLVIVGGGPAGLAAAVYGASEGLSTVLVEREAAGGQAGQSSRIENYLGFPQGISGAELAKRAGDQATRLGAETITAQEIATITVDGPSRTLHLADGSEIGASAVIVATGVAWRRLDAEGADALAGRGIYYGAATTEAMSCQDQDVYIVGGANSAGQAALFFADYASRVTILVRGDSLATSMSAYLVDRIEASPTIDVRTGTVVAAAHGDGHLEALTLEDRASGRRDRVEASSLFVFIGAAPQTEWLDGLVARDPRGFVFTGPDLMAEGQRPRGWRPDRDPFLLEASVPGVFVAGDVRHQSVKRVASAVGEGSMAVQFVHQYLRDPS